MSKTLEQHLERLAEVLEDNSDPWFNDPKGWMKKPRYSRPAQEKSAILKGTTFTNVLGSGYKTRWFVLDFKTHRLNYYNTDDSKASEKGYIDLNTILDVQYSKVFDAPEFSLDLISDDRHYTVVAESHSMMLKWAFAINLALPSSKLRSNVNLDVIFEDSSREETKDKNIASRWFEYQVMYEEEGPLMLNVVGMVNRDKNGKLLNNLIAVTSFDNYPDGTPGVSEQTGMISVKDYIIGVNGQDLTSFTFNEALGKISKATWPKTLHFIRDNFANRDVARIEGWAVVFYPALNRRRKRYIELVHDTINFKKVEPGGSASNTRDAYFKINQIYQIRPVHDKTVPQEQQFTLNVVCYPESIINHVDEYDVSQGGTFVETLELCFPTLRQLNQWRSALVSPLIVGGTTLNIQATNLETIEPIDVNPISMATKVAIKIEATGFFALREFSLVEGTLKWKRPSEKSNKEFKGKGRSLFIANATTCALKSLRMIRDPKKDSSGYEYQLLIETKDRVLVIGMKDELALTKWMNAIKETALLAPPETRTKLMLPTSIEVVHLPNTFHSIFGGAETSDRSNTMSTPVGGNQSLSIMHRQGSAKSTSAIDIPSLSQGYLYLKQEKSALGLISEGFKKFWFVLHDFDLTYYKSDKDVFKHAVGKIDLNEVYAVRESNEESSPENSIEITTANRTFLIVAEDEDDQVKWLDTLADKLEERRVAAQREDGFIAAMDLPRPQKIEAMKRIVQFSGNLHKKNGSIWKERYFVLANRSLTYYGSEDEFYENYKDSLGCIPLSNIVQVCSSNLDKCRNTGFELHAYHTRGERDARGIRVFIFNAHFDSLCKEWMTAICEAVGNLELQDISTTNEPRYQSVIVSDSYSSGKGNSKPPAPPGIPPNSGRSATPRVMDNSIDDQMSGSKSPVPMPKVPAPVPKAIAPRPTAPPPVPIVAGDNSIDKSPPPVAPESARRPPPPPPPPPPPKGPPGSSKQPPDVQDADLW